MKRVPVGLPLALLLVLVVASCSSAVPEERLARDAVQGELAKHARGCITLGPFDKTNGLPKTTTGYAIEFDAKFRFAKSCYWLGGPYAVPIGEWKQLPGGPSKPWGSVNVPSGQEQAVKGEVRFEKTEKGWRATRVEVKP